MSQSKKMKLYLPLVIGLLSVSLFSASAKAQHNNDWIAPVVTFIALNALLDQNHRYSHRRKHYSHGHQHSKHHGHYHGKKYGQYRGKQHGKKHGKRYSHDRGNQRSKQYRRKTHSQGGQYQPKRRHNNR